MSAGLSQSRFHTSPAAAAPSDAFAAADLTCPRCGYDQSGLEQSLRSQCERGELDAWPLRSTCAECGREFQWGNFYNTKPRESEFFETATTRQFRAFWKTVWRMPRAGRFWRGVDAEWPLRPWRMLSVVLVAIVLWFGIPSTSLIGGAMLIERVGLAAERARRAAYVIPPNMGVSFITIPPPTPLSSAIWLVSPVSVFTTPRGESTIVIRTWVLVAISSACIAPLVCGALFAGLLPGRVSWATQWRISCYGLPRMLVAMSVGLTVPRVIVITIVALWRIAEDRAARDMLRDLTVMTRSVVAAVEIPFATGLVMLVTWNWWTRALRDHLRLARSGYLAATVLVIAFLFCWIVALLIPATRGSVSFLD